MLKYIVLISFLTVKSIAFLQIGEDSTATQTPLTIDSVKISYPELRTFFTYKVKADAYDTLICEVEQLEQINEGLRVEVEEVRKKNKIITYSGLTAVGILVLSLFISR